MLLLTTLLWGMSFPWTRTWQLAAAGWSGGELLSSLTLIAIRMPLALLLFALLRPRLVLHTTRREQLGGVLLGAFFFAGFILQTWGLASTTPALSAFFTSLCSAWVPLLGWVLLGDRVVPLTLLGLGVGLLGCAVLVEGGWSLGRGEALTLMASVVFAGQMLLLDRLGRRMRPEHLSAGFLAAAGLCGAAGALLVALRGPGFAAWAGWTAGMLAEPKVLASVACLVVLPTTLAFHWMNAFQPHVPPANAALIYLLEPVFALAFSLLAGMDQWTYPLVLGGLLLLLGNAIGTWPLFALRGNSVLAVAAKGDKSGE
jgi:drug/metabolite transporter (DMT)-like permease